VTLVQHFLGLAKDITALSGEISLCTTPAWHGLPEKKTKDKPKLLYHCTE